MLRAVYEEDVMLDSRLSDVEPYAFDFALKFAKGHLP